MDEYVEFTVEFKNGQIVGIEQTGEGNTTDPLPAVLFPAANVPLPQTARVLERRILRRLTALGRS